jgi:hypothetical protein
MKADEADFTINIGCEKETLPFNEEGTRITSFSMKEELEEGYFNKEGAYVLRKQDDEEGPDPWLASIDWNQESSYYVKQTAVEELFDESHEEANLQKDLIEITNYLLDNETVLQALKRLRGQSSSRERQKTKGSSGEMEQFMQLTALADKVFAAGYYEIYSATKEKCCCKINNGETSNIAVSGGGTLTFSFDEEQSTGGHVNNSKVLWFYKWRASDAEVYGPFSTCAMRNWQEGNFFTSEVQVRREGTTTFYPVDRVDFELYL